MKFSLSWLKTHLDTTASLTEITDRLTGIGLELEGVTDPGAALAPFRVALVVSAVQHPNADRLRACVVDAGDGPVSVVCGAPNARTGMKAVFASAGSFIPGTGITLKVGEIRGVVSAGMLLSRREMGLGDDHDGIVELPEDAPVGMAYPDYAGMADPVIEISVTPNRGDALSIRGVARDLAAAGLGTLRPWTAPAVTEAFDSPIAWAIADTSACPWVLGRTIRGVTNGPSPDWLQKRLLSIGLRPINRLVDVTNFFCFDLGRPLHVFDADRVQGGVLTMRPTEATNSVFIECALFDPVAVALTGRRHALVSDARQRFERGIDPALLPDALDAATRLIQELCGGEASTRAEAGAEPAWRRTATMRFERLASLGGAAVPPDEAVSSLERLGFTVQSCDAAAVTVCVPSWRNDVAAAIALDPNPALPPDRVAALYAACAEAEPEADLIEEVLRLRGLDTIPPVSLPRAAVVPPATLSPRQVRAALARRTMAASGLLECVTFSFMDHDQAALFGGDDASLRVANPIASDLDQMRPTPIATLAMAAQRNAARGLPDSLLAEIGPAFSAAGQEVVGAGLLSGHTPRHPSAPARPYGAMDAKGAALAVLAALGLPMDSLTVTTDAPGWYHPGQSGVVRQGPKLVLATFGALHPRVAAALGLDAPTAAFEVFLDRIPEPKRRKRAAPDLPPFQPVRRDFAFVLPAVAPVDAVLRAARGAERTLITEVRLFDVFQGGALAADQKSVGIEVVFQPRERTLTDAEIEAAAAKVVAAVAKATGAALR
jgi:phenylalanyl-tRNA synthetase beta chain